MNTSPSAATMKFRVPAGMESLVKISSVLPPQFEQYRVNEAVTVFTDAPFGCFSSQTITTRKWAITWFHFSIKQPVTLHPVALLPLVLLCCVNEGNFSGLLQGREGMLVQPQHTFGFYYVPPGLLNEISLQKGQHHLMYISFAPDYVAEFMDLHQWFQELHTQQKAGTAKGTSLPVCYMGRAEMDVLALMRQCRLPDIRKQYFFHARIVDLLVFYFTALGLDEQDNPADRHPENRVSDMGPISGRIIFSR